MSVGITRKLFLDSRFKVSGNDGDFLLELPVDVDCSRTSSFFVASCSFANTYQTVTQFNNLLYFPIRIPCGIPGGGTPRQLWIAQVPTGPYTPQTLAPVLQTALGTTNTVTWNASLGTYDIEFQKTGCSPFHISSRATERSMPGILIGRPKSLRRQG